MRTLLQLLTLVTPFHPSTRWQVGNAMARNKLIYALSQGAVIAATGAGSGGTWTGALENLKHRWVPLHVRDDRGPGSIELSNAGAQLIEGNLAEDLSVRSLLGADQAAVHPDERVATQDAEASPAISDTSRTDQDAFWSVWPLLHAVLQNAHTEREVAETLHLQLGQARSWLSRSVEEGLVQVKTRPRKSYVAIDEAEEKTAARLDAERQLRLH